MINIIYKNASFLISAVIVITGCIYVSIKLIMTYVIIGIPHSLFLGANLMNSIHLYKFFG